MTPRTAFLLLGFVVAALIGAALIHCIQLFQA
jgi:hypothetical protein